MTNFSTRTEQGWSGLSDLFDSLPSSDAPGHVSATCHLEVLEGMGWLLGPGGASLPQWGLAPDLPVWSGLQCPTRVLSSTSNTLREHVLLVAGCMGCWRTPVSLLPNIPLHARKRVGGCSFSYWATTKGRVSLVHKYTCLVFILAHSSGQILAWNYFRAQCYLSWGSLLQTFARDNPCKLIGAGVTNAGRRQKLMDCKTFLHLKDFAIVVVHTRNRSKQTYAHMVIFLHTHMHAYTYLYLHLHLHLYMSVYIYYHIK